MNENSLDLLKEFIKSPTSNTASYLSEIPCLFHVLKACKGSFSSSIVDMCTWLYGRGTQVMEEVLKCGREDETLHGVDDLEGVEDWRVVRTWFNIFQENVC
jgi:hypothetical protein